MKRTTNRTNLIEKFDRGDGVLDYFALEKAEVQRPPERVERTKSPLPKGQKRVAEKAMSKKQDRTVYRRGDGDWVNKRNDADRASSVHDTQQDAIRAAKDMLKSQGGGELTTKGREGKIVSKDTIAPGNDPNPPRDTEH